MSEFCQGAESGYPGGVNEYSTMQQVLGVELPVYTIDFALLTKGEIPPLSFI